jgi:hypothetical protein
VQRMKSVATTRPQPTSEACCYCSFSLSEELEKPWRLLHTCFNEVKRSANETSETQWCWVARLLLCVYFDPKEPCTSSRTSRIQRLSEGLTFGVLLVLCRFWINQDPFLKSWVFLHLASPCWGGSLLLKFGTRKAFGIGCLAGPYGHFLWLLYRIFRTMWQNCDNIFVHD